MNPLVETQWAREPGLMVTVRCLDLGILRFEIIDNTGSRQTTLASATLDKGHSLRLVRALAKEIDADAAAAVEEARAETLAVFRELYEASEAHDRRTQACFDAGRMDVSHEDGCPEDDTCDCGTVPEYSKARQRLLRAQTKAFDALRAIDRTRGAAAKEKAGG